VKKLLDNFVAIDFETANGDPRSVTQVGAVRVENGKIVANYEALILPESEYDAFTNYFPNCENIVDIYADAMRIGRNWVSVHTELDEFAKGFDFVAHNASFDRRCFYALNDHFKIDNYPTFWDTYMNARRLGVDEAENYKLATLSFYYELTTADEYKIWGHNAFYDAQLCAKLCLKLQELGELVPLKRPKNKNGDDEILKEITR
jgi:DNA polymerase-3 subunit epsilon